METLEREEELDRLAAALESAAAGAGRVVVVEGPAGIGKTRLMEDARALAKIRGFGRLQATGDELERAVPWSVVRQLVERSISRYGGTIRDQLLAGPSGAALRALGEAPTEAGAGDAALARTLHALWWVAVDLSASRPLLITVDDAQWSDLPSLRFLSYLGRRVADLPITLVVATRPPVERTGPLAELTDGRAGDRILPRALSQAAIAELGARDGVAPAEPVASAVHAASGGNPFLAGLLLDELAAAGRRLDDPATAAAVRGLGPSTVSRALLARLSPDAIALAGGAAVLGTRSAPELAAALVDLPPARSAAALDALVAGHVLSTRDGQLGFVHPVVRESVLAQLTPGDRASLHARAARALHDAAASPARVAAHLVLAPAGTLPGAAALLRQAGAALLADGDARTAATHLARALDEAPHDDAVRFALGTALLGAGSAEAACEHLRAAAQAAPDAETRARRLAAAASARSITDGPAAAVAELRATLDAWPGAEDAPARLVLEARLAAIALLVPEERRRAAERLRGFAGLSGATPEQRTILALLAQRGRYEVHPAAEVIALGRRALAGGAYLGEAADSPDGMVGWLVAVIALMAAGDTDVARAELARGRERVRNRGAPLEFALVSGAAGWLAWRCGDMGVAAAEAEAAVAALAAEEPSAVMTAVRATATHCGALAALEREDADACAALLRRFDANVGHGPRVISMASLREARALLHLAGDNPTDALREALALGEELRLEAMDTPTIAWRVPAATAALRLGEDDLARVLSDEHLALARRWGAATDLGIALRLAARVDGGERLTLLDEAIATLERSPARLELARALADRGEALRVARRRAEARAPLTRAAELAAACGSTALRRRAVEGLASLGDQPRKLMFSGAESLTASELRVAHFALGGRTNRDIAHELFVTPKTVENHLGRVYVKLGITGRRELAGALG